MPPINVLIKPASGNCNMRCDYCFYYDTMSKRKQPSYGFMSLETLESVIRKVLEPPELFTVYCLPGMLEIAKRIGSEYWS